MSTIRYTQNGDYDDANSDLATNGFGGTDFTGSNALEYFQDQFVVDYPSGLGVGLFTQGLEALTINGFGVSADYADALINVSLRGSIFGDILSSGAGNDTLRGNLGNDTLNGGAGNDYLEGGAGIDTLIGDTGNDAYILRDGDEGDTIIEANGGGTDTVRSAISIDALDANVERLQLVGKVALDATGTEEKNTIIGNTVANQIDGGDGRDVLTGFGGNDTFVFSTELGSNNVDRITDFGAGDKIGLAKSIFAALNFGADAFDANDFQSLTAQQVNAGVKYGADVHIIYREDKGALYYDSDGYYGSAKAVQFAVIDGAPTTIGADDFMLFPSK